MTGIGALTATALVASAGDGREFRSGRHFSASLGLVPRQHATGGRQRLLGISKRGGDKYLLARVSQLLSEPVVFNQAIPELEIRFDSYGKGRFHDLGIYGKGKDSGKSLFVGVEAKVDEPFGEIVKDVYARAMAQRGAGESTNLPDRVDDLLALHFPQQTDCCADPRPVAPAGQRRPLHQTR